MKSMDSVSKLLNLLILLTEESKSRNSDARWKRTVLAKGTLGDKVAALTLNVQDAPLHNLSSLDTLLGMVDKKGRREAFMAAGKLFSYYFFTLHPPDSFPVILACFADAIRDLFLNELLPDKKLRTFDQVCR